MNWKLLAIIALLSLGLLFQGVKLKELESQVAIISDNLQRQELRVKQIQSSLEELKTPESDESQPIIEAIRRYSGFLDDHDVSGLLDD